MKNINEIEQFLDSFRVYDEMAYPPNLKDLYSLYRCIRQYKVVAALEFGVGWSTLIIALALAENEELFGASFKKLVRHPNPFKVLSIDTSDYFINIARERVPKHLLPYTLFHQSESKMTIVAQQFAHTYSNVPPWTADLVYLDGPDCDFVNGDVDGFHVNFGDENKKYGLPMSGDLLRLENFFWPATRIITDGRGANAHFLKNNFTRNWEYEYHKEVDQHHFYLNENPWGEISEKFVNFKEGRLKIE